ncbi:hypothetical protein B7P43_G02902, partial [Cryptotermes secundus]
LLNRCTDVAAQCMEQYIDTVKVLPPALKSKLLVVACNRGSVNSKILCCLLHPNVKTLDLSECSISDDSVRAIYKCTHLYKLDLNPGRNQNREISTAVLLGLFPNIPYLSVLYLNQCLAVVDEVLASIANNCPLLTKLDIGGCIAVTDTSLKLLNKHKYLTSLNISHSQVSDAGILALVQGECRESLRELRLNNCIHITDFAVESIVHHCTNMEVLILHKNPVSGN